MQASSYSLGELIPHRDVMVLIDEVVSCDLAAATLTAAFTAKPQWQENWAAIEFMAQTAAALAGASDRAAGWRGAPRPGFLLGTRKLELFLDRFVVGRRYLATARNSFCADGAASFECEIRDGETLVAKATLTAYRPDDAGASLDSFA